MKINYQIARKSIFELEMTKFRIMCKLKEWDYRVVQISNNTVTFGINPNGWALSGNQTGKVDGGTFEILVADGQNDVVLNYYLSFKIQLIMLAVIVLISFFWGYFVLLLAAGLFLFTIIDISIAKTKCKEMLEEIVADGRTQG